MVVLKIIRESFILAFQELSNNKLRAFLSLLGITIGILCIISVFASVDSLEKNIRGSISKMGDNLLYVEKWPWAFGSDYPWWKYINRPEADYRDFKAVESFSEKAEAVAIQFVLSDKTAQYRNLDISNVMVAAVSHDFNTVYAWDFSAGRYFSPKESQAGDNAMVIGFNIAETLYNTPENAVGKNIKVMGRRFKVVGVLEKEGQSILRSDLDNMVVVPYNYMISLVDENSSVFAQRLIVQAKEDVTLPELKDELTGILRKERRLRPRQEDNFALNQVSVISQGITQTFGVINFAGILIGGFSILVGGFGIANIMFVSVRERTNIIGIKKALGAKKIFIMLEFLIESIVLCILGGAIGLFSVFVLIQIANYLIDFTFILSMGNILLGLIISFTIGTLAGIFPAFIASRMDPVEAIRK